MMVKPKGEEEFITQHVLDFCSRSSGEAKHGGKIFNCTLTILLYTEVITLAKEMGKEQILYPLLNLTVKVCDICCRFLYFGLLCWFWFCVSFCSFSCCHVLLYTYSVFFLSLVLSS